MPTCWAPWPGNSQATSVAVALGRKRGWLLGKARALDGNRLPALVVTTHGAGVMRPAHSPALRTTRQPRQLECEVAAALALARLGITFLWQWWHELIPSLPLLRREGRQVRPSAYRFPFSRSRSRRG